MNTEKTEIKNDQEKKDELNIYKNNRPFYLMTLETNNDELKQIKIYQNSDPFELSYNFCKDNNLDFESMKYVKKTIKEIIKRFNEDEHYIVVDEENYEDENEDEDEHKKRINFKEGKKNKNKKSTNELICSLIKKNIKINHSKINRIAPLQIKINEDIQKINKFKKKEPINRLDYSKKKIFYNVNKTIGENEIENKRCKLSEKNLGNNNIKINTFSYENNSGSYGVPELKNNNSINMIKKIEKFSKNNEINIKTIEKNKEIESDNMKFENEDDNKEDKSSYKEDKKQEIIDLKDSNNKEKFNCFLFNKMINNINNNIYNHNYNVNNNNSININNNNIFNNINPINYNNKYLFNYISLNNSIEDISNSKSLGKMNKTSNRTTRRILNDKFKENIGFKAKIMNIRKRKKKNKKEKNIISFDNNKSLENNNSKEKIKTLLNDYKKSISKNKKIEQINLNKTDKFNKFRELSSSEDSSKKRNNFNNKSLKIKAENLKNDNEIFNREEIVKSFLYSRNSNIYPFIKEIKPIVRLTRLSKNIKSKNIKKNLVDNLSININKYNNSLKIKLRSKSSHKLIKNNSNRSNLHIIKYPNFRSNSIKFNNLKNNKKSLNYSLNDTKSSKYKNTSHFTDIKYINDSFSNNSKIKKDIEQQNLYNILSNIFIFFLIEKSKLVDSTKSLSKRLKIFAPEIKNIYIKMLKFFNNYRNEKKYKMVNKETFINEMINAYNIILTKREKNILQKNIQKKMAKNDKIFSSEIISPICLNNNVRTISFEKKYRNYK